MVRSPPSQPVTEEVATILRQMLSADLESLHDWCESGELTEMVRRLVGAMEKGDLVTDIPIVYQMANRLETDLLYIWGFREPKLPAERVLEFLISINALQYACDEALAKRGIPRLSGTDALVFMVEFAHDMRSPLTSILALAENLRGQEEDGPREEQLSILYGAALGMSSLVSDMLEVVQGGNRLSDSDPQRLRLAEMMESVRDIVKPVAKQRGLDLTFSVPEDGPREGHPTAIVRILLNLVINSLKYTDEGSVEVRAELNGEDRVRFSVRDTGRGLPPELVEDPNVPLSRSGPGQLSTGLGMAICSRLARAMDSQLEVEAEVERGTTISFELTLPRV